MASVHSFLVQIFFFLMLVIPTTFQMQRGALLGLLVMAAGIAALRGRWLIHRDILFLSLLTVSASLFFMLRGAMADGAGSLRVGTVYVLWPLLFLLFIGLATSPRMITPFLKTIIIAAAIAAFMGLWVVAEALGLGVPGGAAFLKSQGAAVGIYAGLPEYSLFNMTTLIYAFPFLVSLLFIPRHISVLSARWRSFAWFALALTGIAMLISGRRSFWLIALVSPLLVAVLMAAVGLPMRQYFKRLVVVIGILTVVGMVAIPIFDIRFGALIESFVSGFDFSGAGEESASIRRLQFLDLMEGWKTHPILGAGHGTSAPEVIRSHEQPWAYELSYLALLYQTGIIGFLIYGCAVLWIFGAGFSIMRRNRETIGLLIPLLAGLLGFLISNGTNPYLTKFDYLWTIFLPVAAINAQFMMSRGSTSS